MTRPPATTISVRVKPNARMQSLERRAGGTWFAQLRCAPVDGKANAELVALLARHFGCRKGQVEIVRGGAGRDKVVRIDAG
jgi:uncharacterized protein